MDALRDQRIIDAVTFAGDNDILTHNPAQGLRKFSGKSENRGVPTIEEVKQVFSVH